ncbi:MAG: hypothetical protein IJD62_00995 [Oscillospiraceae bacterium]|nr:hypothetical protein [Oscillospiraceae bacterium]
MSRKENFAALFLRGDNMPYIPKAHKKYDLLPKSRADNTEVFEYDSKIIYELSDLLGDEYNFIPYGYKSYQEYYDELDRIISSVSDNQQAVKLIEQLKTSTEKLNCKEFWSVLKYIGPSDDHGFGLTNGRDYYWPTTEENPVFHGIIDDEEFTCYISYPVDSSLWQILEDPTGMALQTLSKYTD